MKLLLRQWMIPLVVAGLSLRATGQTSLYTISEEGQWKVVAGSAYALPSTVAPQISKQHEHLSVGASTPAASRFRLLFSRDSADAFNPGLEIYARKGSADAMNIDGSGRKAIVMSVLDTASGRVTTYYYSPTTFQPLQAILDTGYRRIVVGTQTANVQLTGGPELEHAVFYGSAAGGTVPPIGTTQTQVRSKFSGPLLFRGLIGERGIGAYYYAYGFSDESKTNFDLTGNGLYEIIGLRSPSLFSSDPFRLYIYDNLAVVDSIDDARSSLFGNAFTSTLDINSDGRPEVVSAINRAPNFYQWNPSAKKFELIDSLGQLQTMWTKPENVDGDSSKEIIVQAGILGDSLLVYSSSFALKEALKLPGLGVNRYFFENLNASPNKEIIAVATIFTSQGFSARATFVYDLNRGTSPIWIDSTFDCQSVGDFRKVGHSELLGVKIVPDVSQAIGLVRKGNLQLLDPSNGFQPVWRRSDSAATYNFFSGSTVSGPFLPSNYFLLNLFFGLTHQPVLPIATADFNGDGINDFVVHTLNAAGKNAYIAVDANGSLIDTLLSYSGLAPSAVALAYDFNGNGRPEVVLTETPPSFSSTQTKKTYIFEYDGVTSVERSVEGPTRYLLQQNYPNPFNPSTSFEFQVPRLGLVSLKVYDVLGRDVATVVNEELKPGAYKTSWDARAVPSGVYFYRIKAGDFVETKKLMLLR